MNISLEEFQVKRTPQELQEYVVSVNHFVGHHPELVKLARLKKEPYKTFIEELRPFSAFCSWKYRDRTDVSCFLLPENSAGDAVVHDWTADTNHLVEVTWPMDGQKTIEEGRQLNEKGMTDGTDIPPLSYIFERVLSAGMKKSYKDYRIEGGSTLILVFDNQLCYYDNEPKHQLNDSLNRLKAIDFRVDNVVVFLTENKKFIEIKTSNVVFR